MILMYDCIIIGGGPAGLNAALVLGRARRSVAIIDNNKPRNAVTHSSHGFITRDGVKPSEFRSIAAEELSHYPSINQFQAEVVSIEKTDAGFTIVDSSGQTYEAKKLVLATGVSEVFPEIEDFYSFYGKSLFVCPYCDGWEQRDQPLVIVSESPHVFHYTKTIYNWSKDLIVCTNGHALLSDEQKEKLESKDIKIIEQPVTSFLGTDGQLKKVRFADGTEINRSGGFVMPQKIIPNLQLVENLGCETEESGILKTDDFGRTSIKGLYASGDASYVNPSQLIFAAADGSKIAAGINMDLIEEEF
ncbi:NAD(P)/FAD-dependent oxidoreductase [Oceanobacillus kapialis]|uniref:NAD(P)/FAD-dependent oxidoreductase n=1 Tax=Oceanobacillus kapialis TaxID=481353 RepID=A0ABW5Q4A7_9BACI